MDQYAPYVVPLIVIAATMGALSVYGWPRRRTPGVRACITLNSGVAIWSIAYALEIMSNDYGSKVFWAQVQYIGIVIVPTSWIVFSLDYTGSSRITRRSLALLSLPPLAMLLLVWTNGLHHLVWQRMMIPQPPILPALDLTYGPGFWIHLSYSYLLLLLGIIINTRALIRSTDRYRYQAAALLVGALAPWAGNMIYVARLSPVGELDLTPFAFTVTGLAMAWSVFRYHLFEIAPVTYQAVIDGMDDVVIVFDPKQHITALNPIALHFFGGRRQTVVHQHITSVLPWWDTSWTQYSATEPFRSEIATEEAGKRRFFDLRLSPLGVDHGNSRGHVVVLHEVTERKQAENALRAMYDVQTSLIGQLEQAKRTADDANSAKRNSFHLFRTNSRHRFLQSLGTPICSNLALVGH